MSAAGQEIQTPERPQGVPENAVMIMDGVWADLETGESFEVEYDRKTDTEKVSRFEIKTADDIEYHMSRLLTFETNVLALQARKRVLNMNIDKMIADAQKDHASRIKTFGQKMADLAWSLLPRDKNGKPKKKTYETPFGSIEFTERKASTKAGSDRTAMILCAKTYFKNIVHVVPAYEEIDLGKLSKEDKQSILKGVENYNALMKEFQDWDESKGPKPKHPQEQDPKGALLASAFVYEGERLTHDIKTLK